MASAPSLFAAAVSPTPLAAAPVVSASSPASLPPVVRAPPPNAIISPPPSTSPSPQPPLPQPNANSGDESGALPPRPPSSSPPATAAPPTSPPPTLPPVKPAPPTATNPSPSSPTPAQSPQIVVPPPPPTTVAPSPASAPHVGPLMNSPSTAAPPSFSPLPEVVPHPSSSNTPHHRSPLPAIAVDPNNPVLPHNPNSSKSMSNDGHQHSSSSSGLGVGFVAAIAAVLGFLVLGLVGIAAWYARKQEKRPAVENQAQLVTSSHVVSPKTPGDSTNGPAPTSAHRNISAGSQGFMRSMSEISVANSHIFTYGELYEITDGFSPRNLLGEGGFGSVYRGSLPDGREVAVKQLKDGGEQGDREFQAEVEIISRVHHRHLVSLVGYCIANEHRLLVYDYVPNRTLHYHLHGHEGPVLEWSIRVRIAAGAARGIAYLHEDCQPRIIHRDIKSSNILIDSNFEAQVADFGLARSAVDAVTHVTTRVMGTFGYLAPEYASSGKLTERSDVYSFGVVLLELITGRKPVDPSRPLGEESLVEWARPLLSGALESGNLEELADPRLENNFNRVEMLRMIQASAACVRYSAARRPRMSQVVRVLDSLSDIDLSNGVRPGKSELFNVASTAEIRLFRQMAFGAPADNSSDFSDCSSNCDVSVPRRM